MAEQERKAYCFTLTGEASPAFDAAIATMKYAYPDMSDEDCVVAIAQIGREVITQRLLNAERARIARESHHAG